MRSELTPAEHVARLLEQSVWWSALDAPQQTKVRLEARTKTVAANALICRNGEAVTFWPGVSTGLIMLSNTDENGRTATLSGVPPGGWFGEGSLLKDEPRRYDAVALRESTVVMIPSAIFVWLLDSNIGFNRFVLNQINERLGLFIASLESQRLLTPEGRLARCLGQMFNPFLFPDADTGLSFSQTELAQLTGLSRQRVNQALQRLEQEELVDVRYGSVTALNVAALRVYPNPPASPAEAPGTIG